MNQLKHRVKKHWEDETCGVRYGKSSSRKEWFREIDESRYRLEPHIPAFAQFALSKGKKVLEIGVGAGSDFEQWVNHGAHATGVDLTKAAITLTKERLNSDGIEPHRYRLLEADAEHLPFKDGEFDLVYSWGVLHHTPDTPTALQEVFRVLKPEGTAKLMIYHRPSWTGLNLWIRHALLKGRPLQTPRKILFENLESPGTKAYTLGEARALCEKTGFSRVRLSTKLCAGDLLEIQPSKKYRGLAYRIIWKLYPRWLVRLLGDRFGLELLIKAKKATS